MVLGFRGTYFDNPGKVREYVEEMRPMLTRPAAWQPPRDLGVQTNVAPLVGRQSAPPRRGDLRRADPGRRPVAAGSVSILNHSLLRVRHRS